MLMTKNKFNHSERRINMTHEETIIGNIEKIFCWIFGHKHLEEIDDGCGCVDIMWSELCLVCDGDYKEEPLNY